MSLDTRQTGFITALDLEKAFVDLGLDTAANEIKKMIEELSFLTEGKINYTEFLIATLNYKTQVNDQLIHASFTYFDLDNKNYITKQDLIEGFMRSGNYKNEAEARLIVDDYTFQDPENIKFEDYKRLMEEVEKSPLPKREAFRRGSRRETDMSPSTLNL